MTAAVGHPIVLDDGLVRLRATRIVDESVECEVVVGGRITERRGVTVPGVNAVAAVSRQQREESTGVRGPIQRGLRGALDRDLEERGR